jgi:hypothetical protein
MGARHFGPKNLAWPAVYLSPRPGERFEQSLQIPRTARLGRHRVTKWLDGTDGDAGFEFALALGSPHGSSPPV